jgi:hypothetical protein
MSRKPIARLVPGFLSYTSGLARRIVAGWIQFWFTPSDPATVCMMRVVCGAAATLYVLSHSVDLVTWFGPHGLLPEETVRLLSAAENGDVPSYRWSYFDSIREPSHLWFAHLAGLAITIALTLGVYTRLTSLLTLVVILSYVHRAPMITGPWEPVLSMSLLYLCLAPCGAKWSYDSWRRRRAQDTGSQGKESAAATVAIRLMQIHLAALYFTMGMTKLAGDTWWYGEAVWWLIAHTESRLVDLTGLRSAFLMVNLWSHAIVLFELSFGVLIWIRAARPLLLLVAALMWSSLGLLTGQLGFCGMMLAANLSFLDAGHLRFLGLIEDSAADE